MEKKEPLKIVRFALPAAVVGYLGNVVGVAYARSRGWQTDEGLLDIVSHANNFFDSLIGASATALAVDAAKSPRNLPFRKAMAVGGLVLGVGLGLNAMSETPVAHEPPFSAVFAEDTKEGAYDFLYGAAGSLCIAAATADAVRQRTEYNA